MTTSRTVLAAFAVAATAFASIATAVMVTTAPAKVVYELPRVVVTGKVQRVEVAQITQLPRMVVTGRRVVQGTLLAQAERFASLPI